jgi:steroid 5-alpha reductase family enzyme
MSLSGILTSPSQRRTFLLISALIIVIAVIVIWLISKFAPDTRGWDALFSLLISMLASGVFALVSGLKKHEPKRLIN